MQPPSLLQHIGLNILGVDCFIDVNQTIQVMRSQRSWMLSSIGHYKFVYSVIKELVQKLHITKVKLVVLSINL